MARAETPPPQEGLYSGKVMHARMKPFGHRFSYRIFQLFLDVDRIGDTARQLRFFGYNRANLLAFHDKDHGERTGEPLRPWAERILREAGIAPPGGRIFLLCFPRVLGYVFNPISIFYCYDPDGALRALIYEVNNTFGDTLAYAAPVDAGPGEAVIQTAEKRLHVSPFMDMDAEYRFALRPPGERLSFSIRQDGPDGPLLFANLALQRRPLTTGSLLKAAFAHPFLTHKVTGAIHWEALRLWRKGAQYVPRPPAPDAAVRAGRALPASGACPFAHEGQQ